MFCPCKGEDFQGTTRTPDGIECTLGRLAFDIFEPVKLTVLITSIENYIGPELKSRVSASDSNYAIRTRWVARDGSGLKGRMSIEGTFMADPADPNRMVVRFSRGVVEPDDGQDLAAWCDVMGKKDENDSSTKTPLASLKAKAKGLFLKLAFGFRPPAGTLGSRGEMSYEMKRSPKGVLDVLYLDQDMRVSRGGNGALVVTTRS